MKTIIEKQKHRRPVVGVLMRVSSPEQAKEGHSLPSQEKDVLSKAQKLFGEDGFEIVSYPEDGISGRLTTEGLEWLTKKKRIELSRLICDAEEGKLDAVIFPNVDRFARRELIHHFVIEKLQALGVPYYFADLDIDPNSNDGRILIGVLANLSADYSRRLSQRIARGFKDRRAEGYAHAGNPPFGWRGETLEEMKGSRKGYVPHEVHGPVVVMAVVWFLEDGLTTTQIARKFNEMRLIRAGGGTHWDASQISKVLRNPIHAGLIKHPDGSVTTGVHFDVRLIDPEVHEKIIARLKRNLKVGPRAFNVATPVLSGILRCGTCGNLLGVFNPCGRGFSYKCNLHTNAFGERCPGVHKLSEPIDRIVLEEIRSLATGDSMQALALQQAEKLLDDQDAGLGIDLSGSKRKLTKLQTQIDGLVDMRSGGEISKEEFTRQQSRLLEEREQIEARILQTEQNLEERGRRRLEIDQVRQALGDYEAVWDSLDKPRQREFLELLIETCTLSRAQDGTDDIVLRLKLRFLPQQEHRLPNLIRRPKQDGVVGLSPRELALLKHLDDGKSEREIAKLWGTCVENIRGTTRTVRQRLGMQDMQEILDLARPRIEMVKEGLPLTGRRNDQSNRIKWTWTQRRIQVLELLARGFSRSLIATELGLNRGTVNRYITAMMRQLQAHTSENLVQKAFEQKIISAPSGAAVQTA